MSEPGPQRPKRGRLSRSGDFDRAYRDGSSRADRHVVIYAFPRDPEEAADEIRLGISVGRKVGGAADRNRVKRVMREAFWELGDAVPDSHDFVLVGRSGISDLIEREGKDALRETIGRLLEEALGTK